VQLVGTIRDVAIVILALESILIGLALIVTILQLRSLIRLLRDEITPMIRSVNDTVNIVRGTTDFVGDSVVDPVIRVASYGAKARRAIEVVFGRKRR
jgi:hypothetical protein